MFILPFVILWGEWSGGGVGGGRGGGGGSGR